MIAGLQGIAFAALVTGAAFAPPASGAMLLIPVEATTADTVDAATSRGATLLGAGPIAGSLIVRGDREAVLAPMLRRGVLVVAASPVLCGDLVPETRISETRPVR